MMTTTHQNGLEILTASFQKGDTGSAVQLLKRGVDTAEIRHAVLKHKNGEPLRRAYDEYCAAPTRVWIKYNPDTVRFNSGEFAGREIFCNSNYRNVPTWLDTKEPSPEGLMDEAFAQADDAGIKWLAALTKATDKETAHFVVNGHYVHATTRKLVLQLALFGYRPRLVSSGNGKYVRLSETYGEYRYQDIIEVDASVNLNGSEPYQSAKQTALFGSSGSRNTWNVRADGRTIDVTCWN